jgi:hypothetical protein
MCVFFLNLPYSKNCQKCLHSSRIIYYILLLTWYDILLLVSELIMSVIFVVSGFSTHVSMLLLCFILLVFNTIGRCVLTELSFQAGSLLKSYRRR